MPELKRRTKKPEIKYASVQFKGAYKQYTFKTIENLIPGNKVVVRTVNGLGIGEVFSTHLPKPANDRKYNWIIGKIDLEIYNRNFELAIKKYGINENDG